MNSTNEFVGYFVGTLEPKLAIMSAGGMLGGGCGGIVGGIVGIHRHCLLQEPQQCHKLNKAPSEIPDIHTLHP